jgi:hypothetical protein
MTEQLPAHLFQIVEYDHLKRERHTLAEKMMKDKKRMKMSVARWLFIIANYLFALVYSYTGGRQRMFYLLLAQIPLLFLVWGLSRLLAGGVMRDIAKHLTDQEREESTRLAEEYGGKMGMYAAAPFAILCAMLYMLWGVTSILPYVAVFFIFIILVSPFMIKHWKKTRAFMLSTEYAKKQGYNNESANIRVDHISGSR